MLPERAQALIRLLASPNDGEALNACRALATVLRKEGMDFHDLARGFVVKEVRIEQPRAKAAPRRKEVADLLAMGEDMFRPAEWEFLQSLNQWRGEFTPKQQGWLDDIKARARRAA